MDQSKPIDHFPEKTDEELREMIKLELAKLGESEIEAAEETCGT